MSYLTENTTVLSRCSLPPIIFSSNLQENKHNYMQYFSLNGEAFSKAKWSVNLSNLVYCYCK